MMDYSRFLSADTGSFMRSPVREIFKKVDLNSIYSFAGGYPSADTFPLDDIKELTTLVLDKYGANALQYGPTQGIAPLRRAIGKRYGVPVENIQITTSSQQGIDLCARVLLNPGDVVLTSNPSYLGALQSFKSYRARIEGVDYDEDTERFRRNYVDTLERLRAEGATVKFLYIIPDFQNPSGETLSASKRRVLAELATEYDFLIVEDSPYSELRYEGDPVPSIYSMAPERVIHLGSFSKVFAPGFRLGWMLAQPEFINWIYVCKQSVDLCPPMLDQYLATEYLESGRLDANLVETKRKYREKRDLMLRLLALHMPEGVSWTRPEGGLFLFLRLPEGFDAVQFYDKALAAGVAYVAGEFFHTKGGQNTMRLNFSFMTPAKIEDGIKLLAKLIKDEIS